MFGSRNNDNQKKSGVLTGTPLSLNTLVKGTTVEGTVQSEGDIRVDGVIKGALSCNAKVIIGPEGFIEGEIRCENAVIEGRFEGILSVTDLLEVRGTAVINGEIKTGKLTVQTGAVFNVSCKMGQAAPVAKESSRNGVKSGQVHAEAIS